MNKVFPGKLLGQIYNFSLGKGVYKKDDNIFSSLSGEVVLDESSIPPMISVVNKNKIEYKPRINDEVYCKITKVTKHYSNCEILATKSKKLENIIQATIRSESVKNDFKDFDMFDCFCPGDIILAKVISTDLTNIVFVSTTEINHGVVFGRSLLSDNLMMPVSFENMLCMDSGITEKRKVAKPAI